MSTPDAARPRPHEAPGSSFRLAAAPARWVGRFHQGLRTALAADTVTYTGRGAKVFATLAAVAVAYPLLVSVVHALGELSPRADPIVFARNPFFDRVYAESLPFMIAAFGLGVFSPALGALFVLIFAPADLLAAGLAGGHELWTQQKYQPLPAAYAARLISYGLLWILAVELPILSRRWAAEAALSVRRLPASLVLATARAAALAALVFVWASAAPYLLRPVFTWTVLAQFPSEASGATWLYWWVLVLAAALLGGVSGLWPRAVRESSRVVLADIIPPASPAGWRRLLRQVIRTTVAGFLLAGLMTSWTMVGVFAAGALVAGPVLDLLLPHISAPRWLTSLPPIARLAIAVVTAYVVIRLGIAFAGEAAFQDHFVFVLLVALGAPLVRVIMEIDRTAENAWVPSKPPSAWTGGLVIGLLGAAWLALPPLLWADNCPDDGGCTQSRLAAAAAMLAGAAAALGNAMRPDPWNREFPDVFPSGYRLYKRDSLWQRNYASRMWRAFKDLFRSSEPIQTVRATSGVRG